MWRTYNSMMKQLHLWRIGKCGFRFTWRSWSCSLRQINCKLFATTVLDQLWQKSIKQFVWKMVNLHFRKCGLYWHHWQASDYAFHFLWFIQQLLVNVDLGSIFIPFLCMSPKRLYVGWTRSSLPNIELEMTSPWNWIIERFLLTFLIEVTYQKLVKKI